MNMNLTYETLWIGAGSGLLILKAQLNWFDWSNNTSDIDLETEKYVLKEKLSFIILPLSFSCNLKCGFCMVSIAKLTPEKLEP